MPQFCDFCENIDDAFEDNKEKKQQDECAGQHTLEHKFQLIIFDA